MRKLKMAVIYTLKWGVSSVQIIKNTSDEIRQNWKSLHVRGVDNKQPVTTGLLLSSQLLDEDLYLPTTTFYPNAIQAILPVFPHMILRISAARCHHFHGHLQYATWSCLVTLSGAMRRGRRDKQLASLQLLSCQSCCCCHICTDADSIWPASILRSDSRS